MERTSPHEKLHVLIVGGGLCGLATAISITLAGHRVSVFESTAHAHEVGAGLQSSPNGSRLYHRWGLAHVLEPLAAVPNVLEIHSSDGKVLAKRDNYEEEVLQRYGFPLWALHRVDLQGALLARAIELGVEVHYSSRVVDVITDAAAAAEALTTLLPGPGILLESGKQHRGDLVVVADGVWSSLRSSVLGQQIAPRPTGDMAYRITIDREHVVDEEMVAWLNQPRVQIWIGPGAHAIAYSVRNCSLLNIVLLVKDDFEQDGLVASRAAGNVEEVQKLFEGWAPTTAIVNMALK
ncbi:hypothetical protein VPNG_01589 [Cytospora leucostoma]|uniref:FAD-binding domain-containing protein n=1 Tax=Cytospora leucostoma TaxID=1230097 RepID=A0A423XJG8_9PEZI|nr:hypothetical protein VPNG_01589 [Cytospora leucostoma]